MGFRNPTCYDDEPRVIRFQIVSHSATSRVAIAEILDRPIDLFVPRAFLGPDAQQPEIYGTVVEVTDPIGCFLNEPLQMTGRVGFAVYLRPVMSGGLPSFGSYRNDLEPRWEIMSMGAAPLLC